MTTTKQSRSDLKRDQIIKVAGQLFLEHGYNAVTMDSIATAAPVSKPTLYKHFESKDTLFFAVMQDRTDKLFETLSQQIRMDKPIYETLVSIGNSFLDVVMNEDAIKMYRIMVGEGGHFPELGRLFYEAGPKKISSLIATYLERASQQEHIKVDDPIQSAMLFASMIKGGAHMQCLMGLRKEIPPKERAEIVDYAVKVFLDGHRRS